MQRMIGKLRNGVWTVKIQIKNKVLKIEAKNIPEVLKIVEETFDH